MDCFKQQAPFIRWLFRNKKAERVERSAFLYRNALLLSFCSYFSIFVFVTAKGCFFQALVAEPRPGFVLGGFSFDFSNAHGFFFKAANISLTNVNSN